MGTWYYTFIKTIPIFEATHDPSPFCPATVESVPNMSKTLTGFPLLRGLTLDAALQLAYTLLT